MKREVELRELRKKQFEKVYGVTDFLNNHYYWFETTFLFYKNLGCRYQDTENIMSSLTFQSLPEKEVKPFINYVFLNKDIRWVLVDYYEEKYKWVFEYDGKFYLNEQDCKKFEFMRLKDFKDCFEKGIEYDNGKELKEYLKITETGDEND